MPLGLLADLVVTTARERGLEVEVGPEALTRTGLPLESASPDDVPSPAEFRTMRVGCHHIIVASLGDDSQVGVVDNRLRSLLYRAATARMWLTADRKDDLLLLLVGPVASRGNEAWEAHASRFERDDRICRKIVWLPPKSSRSLDSDGQTFLERTFLARPWSAQLGTGPQELDARERLRAALKERDLVEPGEMKLLDAWWPVLARSASADESDSDAAQMIEQLTAALPED